MPQQVLQWSRAGSGVGLDGRFPFGVFTLRRQLGRYKIEFLPGPQFPSLEKLPEDDSDLAAILRQGWEKEQHAIYAAEGMAIGMLQRQRPPADVTGDNIVDSIVSLLRAKPGERLSKAEILAELHYTESQWERFKLLRPSVVRLEGQGRGARYYVDAPEQPRRPPRSIDGVSKFDDYIGQEQVVSRLRKYVESARSRKAPLAHILLSGPPGIGKTTLAQVIAAELGRPLHAFWGPNLDVQEIRAVAKPLDVVFIDEIHALPTKAQEQLFDIMGKGITVIGATTYPGRLTNALRNRFGIQDTLEIHVPKDLQEILISAAARDKLELAPGVALEIAKRSRGSARLALQLLQQVRDIGGLTPEGAREAFKDLEIDDLGLTRLDRRYLAILNGSDEPVGLDAIATQLGENADTVETAIEPYLMQIGLVKRSTRGRQLTDKGAKHIQGAKRKERQPKEPKEPKQPSTSEQEEMPL